MSDPDARRESASRAAAPSPAGVSSMPTRDDPELVCMHQVVYLGGYVPNVQLVTGDQYDVWFLEDRILVVESKTRQVVAGAPTAICASFSARRDLGVLVSPPARSARSTATDAGSPSRSTSCSHPIARASSGRTPAIRLTTMQTCISEAGRRRSFNPARRFSAGGACRRRGASWWSKGSCRAPWAPFPRLGACTGGSRLWLPSLRLAFQKGHLAARTLGRPRVAGNRRTGGCPSRHGG